MEKNGDWFCFSNSYRTLANCLGFDAPVNYPLSPAKLFANHMNIVLQDLAEQLPIVLSSTTLKILTQIENQQYGAKMCAAARLGPDFMNEVVVSDFGEENE